MKPTLCISGVITLLLLTLVLSGWADDGNAVNNALREGNLAYEEEDFETALACYEAALEKSPQSAALHFSAAQAAARLGEDDKALAHYGQSEDSVDKFLSIGNIHYRAASTGEDMDGGLQKYTQALEAYREGIEKYPQNVPLKYNYELVQAKIEELTQDTQQEQNKENEGQDGEENDSQENQQNQENQQGQENRQNQEQNEDAGAEDQQGSQQSGSDNPEENQPQESSQQAGEPGEEAQSAQQGGEEEGLDREAVERILQMLEGQEEASLKNNQEVVGGNEDKNGW